MRILNVMPVCFIVSLSLTINSCKQGYRYSYNLSNNTDSTIYVNFKTRDNDTIIAIAPKETNEIFTTDHGYEGSRGPYRGDIKDDFYDIAVKKGSKMSFHSYLKNDLWTFERKSNLKAVYEAVVTNAEF